MDFRVDLEIFRGPLDLLLYLVRKHEVEIIDIPDRADRRAVSSHTWRCLEQLDVNAVGDFSEMASTLVEIKSADGAAAGRRGEDELEDPRPELVPRLLEYKQFKDAASILDERSRDWQQRYPRLVERFAAATPTRPSSRFRKSNCGTWSARFGRMMRKNESPSRPSIVYDDTPIHVLHGAHPANSLTTAVASFRSCSARHAQIEPWSACSWRYWSWFAITARAEQASLFGEIGVLPGERTAAEIDPDSVDNYDRRER